MEQPQKNSPPKINLADFFQRFSTQVLWHFTGYKKSPDEAYRIVEIDSRLDDTQENNFYYEREWRALHDWNFDDSAIAAIMIPQEFRAQFHELWKERFDNSALISSQMVEAL